VPRRSYNQYCGLARSLDVVGERWTMLVVRNLLLGPLRYSELLRGLPGITTNLLAKRLREMEDAGLIERVRGAAAADGHAYRLTPLGAGLEPAVHALGSWGWQWMKAPARGELRSIEFLFVALRRRYRGGVTLRAEVVADGVPYRIVLSPGTAEIARGETPSPDVRVRGAGMAVARLFLEPPPRGRRAPAGIEVDGPLDALWTLLGAFATEELPFDASGAARRSLRQDQDRI
jgi:DNA-binding HxlR family transcriptional regulator